MDSKSTVSPKKLFIVDAVGALLSAFLLGVVLVMYEDIFGIPASTLYVLAILPLFFMAYDIFAFRAEAWRQPKLLRGIAAINSSYCILSLGFAIFHFESVTIFGWAYVVAEILIVLFLAGIQFRVAQKMTSNRSREH